MNTERESMQSQMSKRIPDVAVMAFELLGQVQEQSVLLANTRGLVLSQAAHIEELEKRIERLESGGF